MTAADSPTLLHSLALGDLVPEIANTRRVLAALPEAHFGWRPHPKSWTLGELGSHVTRLPYWGIAIVTEESFDLAPILGGPQGAVATTSAELLAMFDAHADALQQALAAIDDDALGEQWTLRNGSQVIMQMPRALALRTSTVSHMVHHRAQLGVYLRLLDEPVPATYGPTADDAR